MNIAEIGSRHLSDALTGVMASCDVTEWKDDEGKPVKLYWKPMTGVEQRKIDRGQSEVDRICLTVKHRARDADGQLVFAKVGLTSLATDYDYDVIRAIAFIIAGNLGQGADEKQAAAEKE